VAPLQGDTRLAVVEGPPALLSPEDEIEPAPLVLHVAALARPVLGPGVQARAVPDALAEGRVAGEAQGRAHTLAGLVARAAIPGTLQGLMGAAQLAGRELGPGGRRTRDDQGRGGGGAA
jgi:hypothetical protein